MINFQNNNFGLMNLFGEVTIWNKKKERKKNM